jgi:hypothetical protein
MTTKLEERSGMRALSFNLKVEEYAKLEEYAEREQRTVSNVARMVLREWLKQQAAAQRRRGSK